MNGLLAVGAIWSPAVTRSASEPASVSVLGSVVSRAMALLMLDIRMSMARAAETQERDQDSRSSGVSVGGRERSKRMGSLFSSLKSVYRLVRRPS